MTDAEFLIKLIYDTSKKSAQSIEPSIVIGKVTGVNPLKVKIGDSYEIDEDFMRISPLCRRNVIKIPTNESVKHTHECKDALLFSMTGQVDLKEAGIPIMIPVSFTCIPEGVDPENPNVQPPVPTETVDFKHHHTIEQALPEILLWRGVRVGDEVIVLKFQGGSLHYIMQRVEKLSNDGSKTGMDETIEDPLKEEQL